jgi:HlyD family secretion protein
LGTDRTELESLLARGGRAGWFGRWWWFLVLVAAVVWGAWFWQSRSVPLQFVYETVAVERRDLILHVTASGTVQPVTEVSVSSELSGVVRTVTADYNDRVVAGQVLALLDVGGLLSERERNAAAVDVARANLATAEITVGERTNDLARALALARGGNNTRAAVNAAQAAFDRAIAARDIANAQVRVANVNLASTDADIANAEIRSPIDGVVLARDIEPGQSLNAAQGATLFTIAADLDQMNVIVDVDEADVARLKEGQEALLTVEAYPDAIFSARVVQMRFMPKTEGGVVTYTTVLAIDNSDLALRPGMTATVEINVQVFADALVVPGTVFRFDPAAARGDRSLAARFREGDRQPTAGEPIPPGMRRIWLLTNGSLQPVIVKPGPSDDFVTVVHGTGIVEGVLIVTAMSLAP